MRSQLLLSLALLLSAGEILSAPNQGDVRDRNGALQVWHGTPNDWISPEAFFDLEIKRLDGPTYGTTSTYPPYDATQQWETLIELLPDGSMCPMVFFHARWRRLPDVLALDARLRNYGGCSHVFD